jgi:flagellar basal body-associated protein FliL
MENSDVPVLEKHRTIFLSKSKIIIVVLLFLTLAAGFLAGTFFSGTKNQSASYLPPSTIQPTITPRINADPKLVVDPIAILESPVFTEWGGSVEGKVVAKDADSFTLERNNMHVQIYLQQSLTGFYSEGATPNVPSKTTFEAIKVGDTLRGGVTISRISMDGNAAHHVFANVFTVLNEKTTR